MKKSILHDLLVEMIQDHYSAETQLVEALPKMAAAAGNEDLRAGFEEHLAETEEHVKRLEEVCQLLECEPAGKMCKGMEGLIKEGEEVIKEDMDVRLKDLALIAAAQKVEHYEIAGYGGAVELAKAMDHGEAADILLSTFEEEKATDEKLTSVAEMIIEEIPEE